MFAVDAWVWMVVLQMTAVYWILSSPLRRRIRALQSGQRRMLQAFYAGLREKLRDDELQSAPGRVFRPYLPPTPASDPLAAYEARDALTAEIYEAARASGLHPEWEMHRMTKSVIYPITLAANVEVVMRRHEKRFDVQSHHQDCECGECQMSWPEDQRSRIIRGIAHAHTCRCDECRSKSNIEAKNLLKSTLMLCSSTESPSASGHIGRWSAHPEHYKATCSSLRN